MRVAKRVDVLCYLSLQKKTSGDKALFFFSEYGGARHDETFLNMDEQRFFFFVTLDGGSHQRSCKRTRSTQLYFHSLFFFFFKVASDRGWMTCKKYEIQIEYFIT